MGVGVVGGDTPLTAMRAVVRIEDCEVVESRRPRSRDLGSVGMIPDRAKELAQLYAEHAPREAHGGDTNGHRPPAASSKSDEEVIEKIRSERGEKFERLMRGDLSDYDGDHSSADDALVHKVWSYTQDPEQVRRIHAMSGLHRPEKSGRRFDYLERSIKRAEKNVTWFYQWPGEEFKIGVGGPENRSAVPRDGVPAEGKIRFRTAREVAAETPAETPWVAYPYVAKGVERRGVP